jgi:hypothetical protein
VRGYVCDGLIKMTPVAAATAAAKRNRRRRRCCCCFAPPRVEGAEETRQVLLVCARGGRVQENAPGCDTSALGDKAMTFVPSNGKPKRQKKGGRRGAHKRIWGGIGEGELEGPRRGAQRKCGQTALACRSLKSSCIFFLSWEWCL